MNISLEQVQILIVLTMLVLSVVALILAFLSRREQSQRSKQAHVNGIANNRSNRTRFIVDITGTATTQTERMRPRNGSRARRAR